MEDVIEDKLGVKSGVRIESISSVIKREEDRIIIRGNMISNSDIMISPFLEPDVLFNAISKCGKIIYTDVSKHFGLFSISKKASFVIDINNVSEEFNWEDLDYFQLEIIFNPVKG